MIRTWTPQQADVFDWFATPSPRRALVVRARAGTGKTTVIVEALSRAPEARGGRVLLAAFNKRIDAAGARSTVRATYEQTAQRRR